MLLITLGVHKYCAGSLWICSYAQLNLYTFNLLCICWLVNTIYWSDSILLIGTMTWEQDKHLCFHDTQKFVSQVPTIKEWRPSKIRCQFILRYLTSNIDTVFDKLKPEIQLNVLAFSFTIFLIVSFYVFQMHFLLNVDLHDWHLEY